MDASVKNVVIVGGGFAGTTAAKALQHRLPKDYRVVMISEESYTTFNPMLPEAVGASIFPEQVVAPLRQVLDVQMGSRFIMGSVTAIDTVKRILTCTTLAGATEISYEHLICAYGNRARLDFIPGMAEHALPLKTIGDAMEIRNRVLRRLAQIELESDPAKRATLGHFVVIGGGFSGVEVAGELVDCLASVRRYYPGVTTCNLRVTVVQDADRLLLELPASLGKAAQCSLKARGVTVQLGARASEILPDGVRLMNGDVLNAATVICTIGTKANILTETIGLPVERGRIVVRPDLSIADRPGLWAIGDCALAMNAYNNQPSPPTAQFAVRQARLLADNLLRLIAGKPTAGFRYRSRGMMAAIGHMKGVAEIFGIPISGLPAWMLWRAYYLAQMPTLGRKVRIFVEWTWGMFFPVDITHMRFTRSRDQENLSQLTDAVPGIPGATNAVPAKVINASSAVKTDCAAQ